LFLNSIPFYSVSFRSIISKLTGYIIIDDSFKKMPLLIWCVCYIFQQLLKGPNWETVLVRGFFCYLLILIILLLFHVWAAPFNDFCHIYMIVKMIHDFQKLLAQQYLEQPSLSSHMMFNQPPVIVICSFLGIFI